MLLNRRTLLATGAIMMTGATHSMATDHDILFEGDLLADYFQIYLRDDAHPGLPDDYTEETLARRLAAGPHAVIFHTQRNMPVPVRVQWSDTRPEPDLDAYQHMAEAGFDCPSGRIVLAGLSDYDPTAARLTVKAGPLGIRVSMSGLDSLSDDGLDGDDRYLVQLWPHPQPDGVRVLKAFSGKT